MARIHAWHCGLVDVATRHLLFGSGGTHSKDTRLRRAGWGIVRLDQDGGLIEACHGSVLGKQAVPRAELMALVTLAENVSVAGNYELRVDAEFLLTSMASPTRADRGNNGDLWMRFFRAREQEPQCILRVTRVWRSLIPARELAIGCAKIFDNEATRLPTRWLAERRREWKCSWDRQTQSKQSMAWRH